MSKAKTIRTGDRPNVLFIMADQFRHDWMGCAGADFVRTKNLDRLAERGVRFTQCCTNSPICAPARIGLATGLQPGRIGALGNNAFLPLSVPTYYQRMRDHGYQVGCVGKLDLGKPDKYNGLRGDRPVAYSWGFTHPVEVEGKMHAGSPEPVGPYTQYLRERGLLAAFAEDYKLRSKRGWAFDARDSILPTEAFCDVYIGRRATEWINTVPNDFPFHLFVSFAGPHDPFDPPTEYAEHYRNARVPKPIPPAMQDRPRWIAQRAEKCNSAEDIQVARRQYSGSVEVVDDQVGQILQALEERGLAENTYILFASDHGEMLGDHGFYTKHCAYESSMRVPLIAAGPGIGGGRISDALVELIDLNATICDLSGVPVLENIDARSFGPVLRGESKEHREEAVTAEMNYEAVRTHEHKLINSHNDLTELYDLREDPTEQRNLAKDRPELVRELRGRLQRRMMEGKWLR